MDLNTELEIRAARIKQLAAAEHIARLNRKTEIETSFWARMERLLDPGPTAAERLEAETYAQGEAVVEVIEAQHAQQEMDVLKSEWEGRLD